MTGLDPRTVLRTAAAVVAAIAAVLTIYAVNTIDRCSKKMQDRVADTRKYANYSRALQEDERAAAHNAAAIKMFEALPDPHPVQLADLLKRSLSGEKYEISEQPSQATIEGWQVIRREVTLPEIQLAKLGAFLTTAETQRPPWKLVSCRIVPIGARSGTGRVSLTLDALEKVEP